VLARVGETRATGRWQKVEVEVLSNNVAVAERAATIIAETARLAVTARGQFVFAVSGGGTPWLMLRALGGKDVPWQQTHILQVDERVVPPGQSDRNWTHLQANLLEQSLLPREQMHAMPVERVDLYAAAADYAAVLRHLAGTPPVLDLIHLGLGTDGHTASLFPGDPVCEVREEDVSVSGPRQGHLRMTLTFSVLNRARSILWLITGAEKAEMLRRLHDGDRSIPAGCVSRSNARILADSAAASYVAAGGDGARPDARLQ